MNTLLSINNLKTYFFTDDGVVKAVDGVSYDVKEGETLGVVGESGCGKSVTSLSVMRLLPEPKGRIVEGSIIFKGKDLVKLSEKEMRNIRGDRISMIFQEPMTSLNPVLTIGYQIEEALLVHAGMTAKERRKRAIELLELVGIPDPQRRVNDYPHQMSGGMRQRVMIAMALACNPDLLIADEPTTALDVTIQAQILNLIKDLQKQFKMSVILITHNLGVVAETSSRIVVMYAGKVAERATTEQLFEKPLHPYTLGLLESIPKLHEKKGQRKRLATIPGMVPHPFDMPSGCRFHPRCMFATSKCKKEQPPLFKIKDRLVACWLYETGKLAPGVKLEMPKPEKSVKKRQTSSEVILKVQDLKKYFGIKTHFGKRAVVKAVDGVSFEVKRGETLGLVGESGCGKTTTGKLIVGLEYPTEGKVIFKGQDVYRFNRKQWREFRKKVQMIFQDPFSSLNPRMTVREIVAEGVQIHGLAKNKEEEKQMVAKALKEAGLRPEYMIRYPHEFSGGQRQRIGIARALILRPEVVVCDEPVSALDVSIQAQVINLLQDLQEEYHLTYIFVAHDLSVVRHISDRVIVMYLGKIMEMAETDELFDNNKHPYTEALLSAVPEPDPKAESKRIILEGDVPSPINPPLGCKFSTRCFKKKGKICDEKEPPLVEVAKGHKVACWWYVK